MGGPRQRRGAPEGSTFDEVLVGTVLGSSLAGDGGRALLDVAGAYERLVRAPA